MYVYVNTTRLGLWINGSIRKMIRKRRRLRNEAKRTNNENDRSNYRMVRNKCVGQGRVLR